MRDDLIYLHRRRIVKVTIGVVDHVHHIGMRRRGGDFGRMDPLVFANQINEIGSVLRQESLRLFDRLTVTLAKHKALDSGGAELSNPLSVSEGHVERLKS